MEKIRLATTDDAGDIASIYGNYVMNSPISFELEPPSVSEIKNRILAVQPSFPWLTYINGGEVLGYAYASKHSDRAAYLWSVNTAVYIREDCHRLGIGRALYKSLLACLKLQGFYTAHAGATLPNSGSVALHESMGFRRVGIYEKVGYKFGAWYDVIWWQLPLRDRVGTPAPPCSMAEVQSVKNWESILDFSESVRNSKGHHAKRHQPDFE